GATPDLSPAHTEVLQFMLKFECHFINGTDRLRFVERYIYNREQLVHFDSDVGHYVGDTPTGEIQARKWNSNPEKLEEERAAVGTYCLPNYQESTPFLVNRRVPPSGSQ
ncbi:HB2J protein, partial [Campylorhamphus procurvoides]|nr:HB2J protein [Campylorhamphus procurvoides]